MTTPVNLYSLFLTLNYYDLNLSETSNWITPVIEEINNYIPRKVSIIGSQDLFNTYTDLVGSSDKAISPLDASMTSEPFDNGPPSSYIDASHDEASLKNSNIDASSTLQPIENYKLVFNMDDEESYETLRSPFHNKPDLHLIEGNERPYLGFFKDLKRYNEAKTSVDTKVQTVMTADSTLDNTLTADGINDLIFFPNNRFDASTVSAYRDLDDEQPETSFYDDEKGFSTDYWYRYLSLDTLPLGRVSFRVIENDTTVTKFYIPNPYEGYFASEYLHKDMNSTSPPAIGMGILGSYLQSHDREFIFQLDHFTKLQRDYESKELLPGLPDQVDNTWSKSDLESNQRSLLHNSLFLLFSISSSIDFAENPDKPTISKEFERYIRETVLLFSNSLLPSDTLVSNGFTEEGFPILRQDLTSNVIFLLAVTKYLSFDYRVEIHNVAINIYTTLVDVVSRSYSTLKEDGIDNEPLFFLSLFWFADVFGLPKLRENTKQDLNNYLNNNSIDDELTLSLVWYTSKFYSSDITGTINYSPQRVTQGIYKNSNGTPTIYASVMTIAVDNNYNLINTSDFNLRAEEFKLKLNIYEDKARATVPIGAEWFTFEDIHEGVVSRLIKSLISPLLITELEKVVLKEQGSIETAKGNSLDRILENYELERKPFQRDSYIREFLQTERDNRGSKEHEIKKWLRNRIKTDDYSISFHRMPEKIYDGEKDEERKVRGISDLYKETIDYYESNNVYAVEVIEDDGSISTRKWEEMVGIVDLELKGYYKDLKSELEQVLSAGLHKEVTFVLEATYEAVS